jgi:hypothetical protein
VSSFFFFFLGKRKKIDTKNNGQKKAKKKVSQVFGPHYLFLVRTCRGGAVQCPLKKSLFPVENKISHHHHR